MDGRLILGCSGFRKRGFCICPGVSNTFLNLKTVTDPEIISTLTNHYYVLGLVDDKNQVHSIVEYVIKTGHLSEPMKKLVYEFIATHRMCTLYSNYIEE